MPQSYENMNGTGSDMLFSDIYTEKVLLKKRDAGSLEENGEKIKQALSMNNAVGSVGGYYDDDLSILFMSDFFMKNLGYEYEEFMEAVGGSFRRLVYSQDLHYFELGNFRAGRGAGIFRMMMKDSTPVYVRTYKVESTDKNGVPIWIMSVRMSWDAQNLALVNGVIQSGVWYVDFNENSEISGVTWSQRFRNMLGFSGPEDFPDNFDAWVNRVHPQDRDRVLAEFYSSAADVTNSKKYQVEYQAKCKDGTYHWFKECADVNRRINGTPSRMTGIFVNTDEEHRAKDESAKFAAFHRAYSKANICEYYVDLQEDTFENIKANERLQEEFRDITSWDELVRRYIGHVHEDSREALRLLLDRDYIRAELRKLDSEMSLECRAEYGGTEYWVRNMVLPGDIDENGEPRHAIFFLRDITKAKQAEDDLHKMAKDKHDMDELLSGMVRLVKRFAVCDLEHNSYTLHNLYGKELLKTTGTYDELMAEMDAKFKTLTDDNSMTGMMEVENLRSHLGSVTDIYNFEYCSRDEKLFKNMSAIPLEFKDGRLTRVLLIIQDVTQAKNNEREARAALKDAFLAASRANQAKTLFMSNMSHDIRTPMNAIIGMTAIAGANIDNKNRVLDCLEKITHSSRHLLSLINEVLDMSRIERGGISLVQEEISLPELIDDLLTLMKPGVEQHGHDLSVSLTDVRHEDIIGDRMRIQQVLANILSNAVKYTPDGGTIRLGITEKFNRSNMVCYEFVVEDNGIGMTEEFRKVIFEPFTRADENRTGKIPGTGLGMAITKNIVEMMNGTIQVDSEYGKGTRFTVTVALRVQDNDIDTEEEFGSLPVLIVDDDRACCEGTAAILGELGMQGEWVTSGAEAVERIVSRHDSRNDYFAVIIDWKMPDMDGIETTREIRRRVGRDVPIIVFTAYDCSEVEKEALEAGADAFITKPLFRSRLTVLFRKLVGRGTKKQDPVSGEAGKLKLSSHKGRRVLIVEDNDLNREIAEEIIGMTGAAVESAVNGKEAVDIVAQKGGEYYGMVFMDIQMPVMNGYEAAQEIRKLKGCGGLPIVAMTANAFAEDVIAAKNAGMNDHISKPLDMNKLNDIMNKWIN